MQNLVYRSIMYFCRSQREVFDNLHKKLSKELNDQKKVMTEIIEQSTQAYDQRDEAQVSLHCAWPSVVNST